MRPQKVELALGVPEALGGILLAFSATLVEELPVMEEPARAGLQRSIQSYAFPRLIFNNLGCSTQTGNEDQWIMVKFVIKDIRTILHLAQNFSDMSLLSLFLHPTPSHTLIKAPPHVPIFAACSISRFERGSLHSVIYWSTRAFQCA
jgi:hypothetical protein